MNLPMPFAARSLPRMSLVAALWATLFLTACPGPEWPKCENDEHCKSDKKGNEAGRDYMCVFGQCQECAKDLDCGDGERCNAGRCEAYCRSDSECGEGEVCKADGQCAAKPVVTTQAPECVDDGACESAEVCRAGSCVPAPEPVDDCARTGRVLFDFNVYDLTPEARQTLAEFAECMKRNASWQLTIEGHADERGTTQYNLDLGEKRARSVFGYLGDLGVPRGRMKTLSYGEERPLENGSDEGSWAANRRGELVVR